MVSGMGKIVVVGFGNEILTDDGIGVRIVKELKKEELFNTIKFEAGWLGGIEILDYIENFDTAVLIDATRTKSGTPGDIYHYTPGDFHETLHLSNMHDASFLNTLEMGKKLGMHIPKQIHVLAVEIVEDLEFSLNFSEPVNKRYPEILAYTREFLSSLLEN